MVAVFQAKVAAIALNFDHAIRVKGRIGSAHLRDVLTVQLPRQKAPQRALVPGVLGIALVCAMVRNFPKERDG